MKEMGTKCENSQRINSNILRLNYWYMQEMAEINLEKNSETTL